MSTTEVARLWLREREALMEAWDKGVDPSTPRTVATGSWNGSSTGRDDIKREACVLRFLIRELESEAEVEAVRAAVPEVAPDLPPRPAARAMLMQAIPRLWWDATTDADKADAILDALGWPA